VYEVDGMWVWVVRLMIECVGCILVGVVVD